MKTAKSREDLSFLGQYFKIDLDVQAGRKPFTGQRLHR